MNILEGDEGFATTSMAGIGMEGIRTGGIMVGTENMLHIARVIWPPFKVLMEPRTPFWRS